MQDRFKFRIPMFTDKGSFMEFQYLELGEQEECTLCGYNGEPQQCTGLKDKNGKLIYEGDILKGKKDMICSPHSSIMVDKVGVVEILQNMFVASCRDVKKNCTLFCQNDWVKTEVIGNIYENKELLQESDVTK